MTFRVFLRALADIAAPRGCIVCGSPLGLQEEHLCLSCRTDIPYTHFWERLHNPMADRLNARLGGYIPHGVQEEYCAAAALFFYDSESAYKNIPWQIKYEGNRRAGRHFGALLGSALASSPAFGDVDTVIPVPLHPLRRLSRGYNQAELIAREAALALGAVLDTSALRRTRRTGTQIHMSMSQKEANVSGAFSCTSHIQGRHILLVDDTFTTGSTLAACYSALRPCTDPSCRISFATLAYVGR